MQLTDYQRFIHASRYARWLPDESRRETWKETVDRYTGFFSNRFPEVFPTEDVNKAKGKGSVHGDPILCFD